MSDDRAYTYIAALRERHAQWTEPCACCDKGYDDADCTCLDVQPLDSDEIDTAFEHIDELERRRKSDRGLFLRSLEVRDERIAELEAKRDWAKAEWGAEKDRRETAEAERDELAAELGQLSATYDRLVMETDTDRLDKLAAVVEAAHGYKRALAAYHNSNRSHEGGANKALNRAREAMLAALDAQTEGGKDGE